MRRIGVAGVVCLALAVTGCEAETGSTDPDSGSIDPTPEKMDGTPSREFEADDIEAAENASEKVQDYCSGAVSEAQRVGCEAHIEDEDVPDDW